MKRYVYSLILLWLLALPAHAVLDGAVCSTADVPGGTSCNAAQLKTYINEEDQGLDDRAPLDATTGITGTDAYTASVSPAITAYDPEMSAWVKVPNTNTGAVTIKFNSLAFKPVVSSSGSALGAGDMRSDTLYLIKRFATNDEFRIVTQLGAGAAAASNNYVTIGNTGSLTSERALTAGTGLGLTDGGANSTATLAITDAELACILAQTSAADKISYWTGSGTCGLADFSSAIRTWLTTASVANLASVLTDEASGWATFQATPSMANLGSFLTDDASGFITFGTTPSMVNLGSLLTDEASGWITFGTTPTSANARALYTDEIGTGVLFFLGAPASDDQAFVSTSTSAGAWGTLPDSDAATQKLQYDQTTNVFSAGTDDDIPDAGDFTNLALSGDVASAALVTTIQANAVALTTDTTGNYAAGDAEAGNALTGDSATAFFSAGTIEDARIDGSAEADEVNSTLGTQTQGNYLVDLAAGAGIAVTHTPAEGSTGTIAFSYADQGASPALAADACQFTSNATTSGFIVCEGDTADAFESRVHFTDPTADRLLTVPNADSNSVQPLTCGGTDKVSAISALGVVTCTADAGGAGSGDNISVNGTSATDADFDDATPAAVSGANVLWQKDAGTPNNISGYIIAATTAAIGVSELATSAETETGTDTVRTTTPAGVKAAIDGKKTISIPAGSMIAETTTGCAPGTVESATSLIMYKTMDCDGAGSLQEGVQFMVTMPKSSDEGTLTARVDWTAASGTGDVIWLLSCAAYSNDDALATANFGTEISVTDTVLTALDLHQSPESGAITPGGTWAEGDDLWCRIQRDGDAAGDTLNSVDAKIIAARFLYTTNAFTDD